MEFGEVSPCIEFAILLLYFSHLCPPSGLWFIHITTNRMTPTAQATRELRWRGVTLCVYSSGGRRAGSGDWQMKLGAQLEQGVVSGLTITTVRLG